MCNDKLISKEFRPDVNKEEITNEKIMAETSNKFFINIRFQSSR